MNVTLNGQKSRREKSMRSVRQNGEKNRREKSMRQKGRKSTRYMGVWKRMWRLVKTVEEETMRAGCTASVKGEREEFFSLLLTDGIVIYSVTQTNLSAQQFIESHELFGD